MSNDFKELESGDVVWFSLSENAMPDTAEVEDVTDNQVALRMSDGLLVADVSKFHLLEKWWGHGPLGDGTGMGPDGFDNESR